ncbi:MAG: transporter substrate-binding domain-containing protein [Desulforhopalus sp.]|nr:transporter substrate-binding domain-containing protein [Desulforhopalus sp.]
MKKVLLLFLLTALVAPGSVPAGETIVYGYDEDYPPWEKNTAGAATGINIDIMRIVAGKLGMEVRFASYPFKRILALLRTGDIDMAGGLEKKPEREAFADFLLPAYQQTRKVFLMKKGSTLLLEKYADLYGLKVGLRSGTKHFEPFDSDPAIVKVEADSVDELFKMLLFGRYDVAIGGNIQLLYAAKASGYADKIQVADYRVDMGAGGQFVLSHKSAFIQRKAEFEAVLLDMFTSGQIDAIITSYLQ